MGRPKKKFKQDVRVNFGLSSHADYDIISYLESMEEQGSNKTEAIKRAIRFYLNFKSFQNYQLFMAQSPNVNSFSNSQENTYITPSQTESYEPEIKKVQRNVKSEDRLEILRNVFKPK